MANFSATKNVSLIRLVRALLKREAEQTQLLALRSQLDPHFLFNTLNAIAEWCREDGIVAERAVLQLAAILRIILEGVKTTTWPLAQEIDLIETLFSLHRLRDPQLFELNINITDVCYKILIPPLILLPLAENAVKHGPHSGHIGKIYLIANCDESELVLTIINPGTYLGPRLGSVGLPHLKRRLDIIYGGKALFNIAAQDSQTHAVLHLPINGPINGELS
ncbi:MAG: histidine kinase [Deltaproteobacteria bacterium]|nr:histidine kinase [Deltaproteobacteria bacterium]